MTKTVPEYIEPVIFYFSGAHALARYEAFAVDISLQTREYRTESVRLFTVVGKVRGEDRREVIAEFPAQGMADTFCDMAKATIKAL